MVNDNAVYFWERVKTFIKQRNTTQNWVSQQCGVSINVFKSWISNNRLPDAAQSVAIAKSLNTTVEYLVTGDSVLPKPDVSKIIFTLDEAKRLIESL